MGADVVGENRKLSLDVLEVGFAANFVQMVVALIFKLVDSLQVDVLIVLGDCNCLDHEAV